MVSEASHLVPKAESFPSTRFFAVAQNDTRTLSVYSVETLANQHRE